MNTDRPLRSRRQFLLNTLAACACIACDNRPAAGATPSSPARSAPVTIENFSAAGASEGTVTVARVVKTEEEWRKLLSPDSYRRDAAIGHRAAFSGKYDKEYGPGLYRCICCDTALFDSKTKFDSGTGWPSFWQTISRSNVGRRSRRPLRHAGRGHFLRPLRRASRARLQRRAEADGPALLHEFRGAQLRAAR